MNRNWLLRHQRRERLAGFFSGVLAAKVFAGFGSCSRLASETPDLPFTNACITDNSFSKAHPTVLAF